MSEENYLDKLRELASKMVSAENIMVRDVGSFCSEIDLKLEQGKATARGLFKNKDCAIALVFQTAGSIYPMHMHAQHEVAGVISGVFTVEFLSGTSRKLEKYEHIYLPPNTPHRCIFHEDTWTWVVTMPAAPEFPDAGGDDVKV